MDFVTYDGELSHFVTGCCNRPTAVAAARSALKRWDVSSEKSNFLAVGVHLVLLDWFSGFVLTERGDAGNIDFLTIHLNQSETCQFIQGTRKMLLSEIEA